jgi:hypothetical protein
MGLYEADEMSGLEDRVVDVRVDHACQFAQSGKVRLAIILTNQLHFRNTWCIGLARGGRRYLLTPKFLQSYRTHDERWIKALSITNTE